MFRVDPHPPSNGDFPLWNVLSNNPYLLFTVKAYSCSIFLNTKTLQSLQSNLFCSSEKLVARMMMPVSIPHLLFGNTLLSINQNKIKV